MAVDGRTGHLRSTMVQFVQDRPNRLITVAEIHRETGFSIRQIQAAMLALAAMTGDVPDRPLTTGEVARIVRLANADPDVWRGGTADVIEALKKMALRGDIVTSTRLNRSSRIRPMPTDETHRHIVTDLPGVTYNDRVWATHAVSDSWRTRVRDRATRLARLTALVRELYGLCPAGVDVVAVRHGEVVLELTESVVAWLVDRLTTSGPLTGRLTADGDLECGRGDPA